MSRPEKNILILEKDISILLPDISALEQTILGLCVSTFKAKSSNFALPPKPQLGGSPSLSLAEQALFSSMTEQNPTDISYVYSGYAPLSVRLAQLLSRPGWRSIEEVLRILPGPHFEERQPLPTGLQKKRKSRAHICRDSCTVSVVFVY